MPRWRNGRRGGLKIRYQKWCVGSTPSLGTTEIDTKNPPTCESGDFLLKVMWLSCRYCYSKGGRQTSQHTTTLSRSSLIVKFEQPDIIVQGSLSRNKTYTLVWPRGLGLQLKTIPSEP